MKLFISSIRFKRTINTPLEAGIEIVSTARRAVIVDLLGKVVEEVWYTVYDDEMSINWEPKPFKERTAK